ncbi:hypothetical protein [uncultured Porphyromonas sp.]|uniref:hypothetical protein n=1 Tax=uncultured Porphyromonas sp. TaxID=159274 RepID=UPI0026319E6B|nr:hypothetical protein [uncultured Porphyromonas sp.]
MRQSVRFARPLWWLLALLFLLPLGREAWGQTEECRVTARIVSAETGKAIVDVLCSVWDGEGRRTGFTQSDTKGEAHFRLSPRDVRITFALLGYTKQELRISEQLGDTFTIRLQPSTTPIREVRIKAHPIRMRGDTLHYRVKAFAGKQDRYLEDVIKKLPGIEVKENGRIEYQGRAINKFYIEGQDPLGSNYTQASRNIPVDAVEQVDIIEHNQHKRILQGFAMSDQAALNIRLSKGSRFRPFGEVMAGTGVRPPLWEGKTFLMQAGRTNQLITTLKGNNTGTDLSGDFAQQIDASSPLPQVPLPSTVLETSAPKSPPLDINRYLDDRSFNWGFNDLQKLTQYSDLRLNVSGYHDRRLLRSESERHYLGTMPLDLYEASQITQRPNYYNASLRYELNAPKRYLLGELTFGGRRSDEQEGLNSNSRRYALQLRQEPLWLQASLQTTLTLGGALLDFVSSTRGYTAGEILRGEWTEGALPRQPLHEMRRITQLHSTHRASMIFHFGRTLSLSTGLSATADLRSYDTPQASLSRSSGYRDLALGLDASFTYRPEGFYLSAGVPMTLEREALYIGGIHDEATRLRVSPFISLRKGIGQRGELWLRGGYAQRPDLDTYYSPSQQRRGYRLYYQSLEKLYTQESLSGSLRLSYRDPLELFFAYLHLNYLLTTRGYYRDYTYSSDRTVSVPIDSMHHRQTFSIAGAVDRTISVLGLSLHAELKYSHASYLSSQARRTYPIQSNILQPSLTMMCNKFVPLELAYTFELSSAWIHHPLTKLAPVLSLRESLEAALPLGDNWLLGLQVVHSMNETSPQRYKHTFFGDLDARWTVSKRLKLSARIANLWGQTAYQVTHLSATEVSSFAVPLRPRELIVTASFRI